MRLRPVLMPGGWPIDAGERETCARAVISSGGDLERVYDEPGLSLDAYIRHICRVPLFKLDKEHPLVFITGRIHSVMSLLAFYTRLFELTDQFDKATWLAFLPQPRVHEFLQDAQGWGETDTWDDGIYCWYTSPVPILVLSSEGEFSRLRQAVSDVTQSPASGVVAVSEPLPTLRSPAAREVDLPAAKAPTHVSFNSLARLRLETQSAFVSRGTTPLVTPRPRMTTPPPSNPRIRRSTG